MFPLLNKENWPSGLSNAAVHNSFAISTQHSPTCTQDISVIKVSKTTEMSPQQTNSSLSRAGVNPTDSRFQSPPL